MAQPSVPGVNRKIAKYGTGEVWLWLGRLWDCHMADCPTPMLTPMLTTFSVMRDIPLTVAPMDSFCLKGKPSSDNI